MYYTPYARTQERQFEAKEVALYSPSALRSPGAVTHRARVLSVEARRRGGITSTPWQGRRDAAELQVLYHLGPIEELQSPIVNDANGGRLHSFANHRWTSLLALERAANVSQLLLETEPEWRLFEELGAAGIDFGLRARRLRRLLERREVPHACFVIPTGITVVYLGESGFLVEGTGGWQDRVVGVGDVVRVVRQYTG